MKKIMNTSMLAVIASMAFSQTTWAGATTVCSDATDIETKTIAEVQGDSSSSPLLADGVYESDVDYKIEGIVSTKLYKTILLYSFDGNPKTSDGLYVYMGTTDLPAVGDTVCVKGKVKEYFGLTQVTSGSDWELIDNTTSAPGAIDLKVSEEDDTFADTLERHEGMLVNLPQDLDDSTELHEDMRVTRPFGFDFELYNNFNKFVDNFALSYARINQHPNQVSVAGSVEAEQVRAENESALLFVEADARANDAEIPYYPDFQVDPKGNHIRINDSAVDIKGVITYTYGRYRLVIPDDPQFDVSNSNFFRNTPRESQPPVSNAVNYDQFTLRVATQNVLNYFNSPFGGEPNPNGSNRGAESLSEFDRQTDKLVSTLFAMNADVLGLLEVENNGFGKFGAIAKIRDELNNKYYREEAEYRGNPNYEGNKYAFVAIDSNGDTIIDEKDMIGGDAVTTGIIYRPSKMTLEAAKVIPMPSQHAPIIKDEMGAAILDKDGEVRESGVNYQRDSLMATFIVHGTGKRLTIVANHFKSKGSTCWEDWQGWETWENFDPVNDSMVDVDFQGNCENFRVAAAVQLGEYLEDVGGDRIILGDLNAYTYEDPLLVLTSNPTGKNIRAARDTYIGKEIQFGSSGKKITKTYGYLSAAELKDHEKGQASWSFSYNDEVGSLDHMLISPSLKNNLVDAVEWHINAAESSYYDYSEKHKGSRANDLFDASEPYRSSDHDPAIMTLGYHFGETNGARVHYTPDSNVTFIPYAIPASALAQEGDYAVLSIEGLEQRSSTVAIPKIKLSKGGVQTVFFEVANLDTGNYKMKMSLIKGDEAVGSNEESVAGKRISVADASMNVSIGKKDKLTPEAIVAPYDGSGGGGSFGHVFILGLLMLFGFSNIRQRSH